MPEITSRLCTALADRYKLERHLGEGGMATVYLAEDLKHHRKVAVKVLRPELAAVLGAERFVQEITTTANLQHPHILPLFDSGEADSFLYYVMPFVEGETLRDKLNRETQLGIDEAVRITTEVADALDYAHRQNVIHRDIKPENILLHDGRPMVADFGIALAVSAAAGGRMTETGMSLGTPHYMSPEQATAEKDLTNRSDIYSLGCVLYEMLTGEPPHTGASAQAIVMKIVAEDVQPVTELRKSVPPHVAAATAQALEKLAADRFPSAAKFAEALTNPAFTLPTARTPVAGTPARGMWNRLSVGLAVVAAAMTLTTLWAWLRPNMGRPSSAGIRLTLQPLDDYILEDLGPGPGVAVSPDGENLVFVARRGDTSRLFVRRLNDFDPLPLPETNDAWAPFFSPDGAWVGFFSQGRLKKVSLGGGALITVAEAGDLGGASWGEDGWIVFDNWPQTGLWRVRETGGPVEQLEGSNGTVLWPQILPGGRGILVTRLGSREFTSLAVYDAESREVRDVVAPATYGQYIPTGHLVYGWAGELLAVSFDLNRLKVTGTPQPVLQGVMTDRIRPRFTTTSSGFLTGKIPHFGVGPSGLLVYVPGQDFVPARSLAWVDQNGVVEDIPLLPGDYAAPRVSPDQRMLAFVNRREGETFRVWTYDLRRGVERPLTDDAGGDFWPIWRPDGRGIVFTSNRYSTDSTVVNLFQVLLGGVPERLGHGAESQQPQSWTTDGEELLFTQGLLGDQDVLVARLDAIHSPDSAAVGPGRQTHAHLSSDGQWVAYASGETGRSEVYVRRLDGSGSVTQVSVDGGHEPLWAPNQATVYYRDYGGDRIMAASITLGADEARVVGDPHVLTVGNFFEGRLPGRNYDLAPDGSRFLVIREPAPQRAQRLHLVLDFFEDLKAKVGN